MSEPMPSMRTIAPAVTGDASLGPLAQLPGTWTNRAEVGWNVIALPWTIDGTVETFRLLVNQYTEVLKFTLVDGPVPNRGFARVGEHNVNRDQLVTALDYEQAITQSAADSLPVSSLKGEPGLTIHHEPGLLLLMAVEDDHGTPTLARLATIPHGDAVLAPGRFSVVDGLPALPVIDTRPIGVAATQLDTYLEPYRHFHDHPFQGVFDPTTDPAARLAAANEGVDVVSTTVLEFDTTLPGGGIHNVPFVAAQADATAMTSTFFIQELAGTDADGRPRLRLQYAQVVELEFEPRSDGGPGRIRWPHVSVNTLEKVSDVPDLQPAALPG